ncbi:MAG: NADH:flavin oxidoreductase/NADH oxidase [Verrucomicrobium sp.]
MSSHSPDLFSPWQIRSQTFRNRIGVSPMCQYSSEDGFANDWHLVHLGSRAVGGAGLIMTEAAAVVPEGRISPKDLGIWKDEHVEMLSRIFKFVSQHGAVPGVQLGHAGRKASTAVPWEGRTAVPVEAGGWLPVVAPSAIPFSSKDLTPEALDKEGITKVVHAFASAAVRALNAGAGFVEVHAAHGYLLHQFLSPLSNQRTDEYGGSFDNRTRIVREVVSAVREVWPDSLPLFIRISATDWAEGGWDLEQSVALAATLKDLGVDVIDCSSGGTVPHPEIPLGPGYQVEFAARIRREAGVATAAVGMITSPAQADQILRTGQADMVLLAREMLRDPYWPLHAARSLGRALAPPVQYARAY